MYKILTFLLLVCSTATLADTADEVRCREIGFSRSVETGDIERFRSFLDADARFVGASVLRGRDEVAAAWSVFFAPEGPQIMWRPRFVEVLKDGELALTRGPYRMIVTGEDGQSTESWGTFNSVWRLHSSGEWRVVFDAGSPADQAPAAEIQALLEQEDPCGSNE